jgi:hypothetical protein
LAQFRARRHPNDKKKDEEGLFFLFNFHFFGWLRHCNISYRF